MLLEAVSGLPLELEGGELKFSDEIAVAEYKTRSRGELAVVALQPDACIPSSQEQYWMYNGVALRNHLPLLQSCPVRYELTLISANPLGIEKSKTLGHLHNSLRPTDASAITFSEIFEVLHGIAHFLFYTLDKEKNSSDSCGWVEAAEGEILAVPPNLYHLTINAGDTPLLFADLISERAFGIYDDVKATHGAPFYETNADEWVHNPKFRDSPAPRKFSPPRLALSRPLYSEFVLNPTSFEWLDDPDAFARKFPNNNGNNTNLESNKGSSS